jgi:hypothetical protein
MKKLLFIIPILTVFNISSLRADTPIYGCRHGLRIWTFEDTSNPHPNYPSYYNYSNTYDNGYKQFDGRCYNGGTSDCYIYHPDGTLRHQGTLGYISFDNCPIDDYVFALFIFAFSVAVIRLKKQASLMHEG